MTPIPHAPQYARSAGAPLFGKRTERLETSVSALTKELCEEEAKRAGFPTIAAWQYSVIVHIVHRKHSDVRYASVQKDQSE